GEAEGPPRSPILRSAPRWPPVTETLKKFAFIPKELLVLRRRNGQAGQIPYGREATYGNGSSVRRRGGHDSSRFEQRIHGDPQQRCERHARDRSGPPGAPGFGRGRRGGVPLHLQVLGVAGLRIAARRPPVARAAGRGHAAITR